jgi:hypothetical protein
MWYYKDSFLLTLHDRPTYGLGFSLTMVTLLCWVRVSRGILSSIQPHPLTSLREGMITVHWVIKKLWLLLWKSWLLRTPRRVNLNSFVKRHFQLMKWPSNNSRYHCMETEFRTDHGLTISVNTYENYRRLNTKFVNIVYNHLLTLVRGWAIWNMKRTIKPSTDM